MPAAAVLLALAAAGLHALWNVLLAGTRDTEAATAVALVVSVVVYAPVAALTWDVEWKAAPYVAASAGLELAYFSLLAAAYRRARLSLVYPLARGLGPVLVLAFAVPVLGASTSGVQIAGVLLVGVGVVLVRGLRGGAETRGVALAVVIAACIAAYTLVDKEGLRYAEPIGYLELVLVGPALLYAAAIGLARGSPALRAELRPRTVVASLAMFGAYALVLAALQLALAAPVAAVRESSILIATVLAARWLQEPVGLRRLVGSAVVVAGVALVVLS
jgi:drug/metabolite transporter (DMT)-like permease